MPMLLVPQLVDWPTHCFAVLGVVVEFERFCQMCFTTDETINNMLHKVRFLLNVKIHL
jgi:hypothetical protein